MAGVEEGLPQDVKDTLKGFTESLDALEEVLGPLLNTPWDVLTSRLEPLEKAKLNLMIAYAVESLYFIYLKTQVRWWETS
jgi:exosome complex protein LRP1